MVLNWVLIYFILNVFATVPILALIGGRRTDVTSYFALVINNDLTCGGMTIAVDVILVAGHCLYYKKTDR